MGLSQQKLADMLDVSRGKVAGYFYETQAKTDFNQKLSEKFHLDLGKFLTVEMEDDNYMSFFTTTHEDSKLVMEPESSYRKSDAIDLLLKAKKASTKDEQERLIEEAIVIYGKIMDENSRLKDELMEVLKKG